MKVQCHSLLLILTYLLLVLQFQIPLAEVERRTMWLTVWHSDMFGRNDFLGEVMLPLQGQELDDPSPKWYSLQDRVSQRSCRSGT